MSLPTESQLSHQIARVAESANDTAATAVPQHLVDKFQSMLAQAASHAQHAQSAHHETMVTKAVEEQSNYYRQVPNDVLYMTQHMSALTMERLAAADMTIQLEIASLNADLQVKMATVQSSKDAVQTLMKNQ
jgi:type III secretion inner rod protein HrpB2